MRLGTEFFRSKLARRMLLVFMICALLPISALAAVSFAGVSEQLYKQGQQRLRSASKSHGLSIIARLQFLEAEMKSVAPRMNTFAHIQRLPANAFGEGPHARFNGMIVVSATGRRVPVLNGVEDLPELAEIQELYDRAAGTVVYSHSSPESGTRIFMAMPFERRPARGMLLAELSTTYLWGTQALTASMEICIVDESKRVLFSSQGVPASFLADIERYVSTGASGEFEWKHQEEYIASYRTLFLKGSFLASNWTIVLSESKTDVLAPVASFRRTLSLALLLALWVVLLLSLIHIRRSLGPLAALRAATRRIAAKDFKTRVTSVKSGDEFEELATSFNSMAEQLDRQFHAMTARTEIDRAILSALDVEKIVKTVLIRLPEVVPCDCVAMTLVDAAVFHTIRTYVIKNTVACCVKVSRLKPGELRQLHDHPGGVAVKHGDYGPRYLAPLAARGNRFTYIMPVFVGEDLVAALVLGYREPPALSQDDRDNARQLADQVAVALANARLIEELDQSQWGTLSALGRAIDAKSPWTMGHTERVTDLVLRIGRVMGLGAEDLDTLRRGGLVHDIGKIGVPQTILDKPAKLTEEETAIMRRHVEVGARIIEPIASLARTLPIVLQHHEFFDGSGYPRGLAGEGIDLLARIFAVADAFDAMISDRPYRARFTPEEALERIQQCAGSQFDPEIVEVLQSVLSEPESVKSLNQILRL